MAEDTKKVARLDFDIEKALSGLDKIDTKLKTISESSEKYAKKIGQSLGSGIDKKNIDNDIKVVERSYDGLTKYEKNRAADVAAYRQKQEIKTTETLKREHAKQEQSVKTVYDKIANYAGTYLIYQGFNVLKRSIGEVIDEMVDLESAMVQIDRVLNETSLDIDHYRDKLIQLAYDYGNSFNNVADITLRLAQAGFDSQEALALTEKTLLALNTAELNATQATSDMVSVMSQWGLMTGTATEQARKYGEIIDKINKVADNYPTTSTDIMNALKKVSSAFNLAGASIDETIATIVAAEKASQRGGKVIGTALSNITQQLKAEGKLNLAEQMGLNFFTDDTKTTFKPIMEIFQEMAERMEKLKSEGKESSVEMQKLLELFTVFRRNIGASLLGEMAGEDSTYANVLKTSINSVGYSLQENEKHMKTAKAAQEQFNATLLQLKTAVWDNGIEDVFRSMLILGNDVTKVLKTLIDTFGSVPTVIGMATLAFTAFNKQLKTQVSYKSGEGFGISNDFLNKIKQADKDIKALTSDVLQLGNAKVKANVALTEYVDKVGLANVSTKGYISYLVKQKAATIAAEAATLALNTALSLGLSAGITLIISGLDKLIHKEENATKKAQERVDASKDLFDTYEKERNTIDDLIKQYEELAKKTSRTPEDELKIYEIQTQINSLIKDQKKSIDLVNGAYDETIKKLKQISSDERERSLKQAEIAKKEAEVQAEDYGDFGLNKFEGAFDKYGINRREIQERILPEAIIQRSPDTLLKTADYKTTIQLLEEFKQKLEDADATSTDFYSQVIKDLKTMYDFQNGVNEATDTYNNILAESKIEEMFPEDSIKNAEDYKKALNELEEQAKNSTEQNKIYNDTLVSLFKEKFPEFTETIIEGNNILKTTEEVINDVSTKLNGLQNQYNVLTTAEKELNETGYVTASTFKSLVDNNLLEYLDVVNGQITVNTGSMAAMAEETKIAAIESLKAAASEDIHKLALGKEADMSITARNAIANFGNSASNAGAKARNAAGAILELANALAQAAAANSELAGENNVSDFSAKASAISGAYQSAARKIGAISISSASGSSSSRRSSGGGSRTSSGGSSKTSTAQQKKEDEYKKRLEYFTNTIEKMENKEEEWVKKQKELGLLSNNDMVYVTQQRIRQYEQYLKKIKKATWMNKEDRKKLEEEYTQKLKDLQLDYFDYLKGKLDDEIKAIEDARDKKIKALEEETDKKISLLKKQREAEKNINERQEILDDIAYWEQRTGREAVEKLAEARAKLAEFDRDAQIEAQIEALEAKEKAQKESIERQTQNQIDALQKEYEYRVKVFSESNKIIYDDSTIAAKNLYNTYKKNFVDPLKEDLQYINKKKLDYTVKKGDTLESIAKEIKKTTGEKVSTIIKRIKKANSSLKNTKDTAKLKKGTKIKIPMYHQGGIFSGAEEGLALLKRGEWVLRPEWSNSLNRMMKYFDNVTQGKTNGLPMSNNSTIEVERKFD